MLKVVEDVAETDRAGGVVVAEKRPRERQIPVLDGWRGISILCVLACHMLPLGPKRWELNACAGPVGMALFFTLSGFLITTALVQRMAVTTFFIRRGCRILPLVFLFIPVALLIEGVGWAYYPSHFAFAMNYVHRHMTDGTAHLWSVCVEVHFYVFVGLLVALGGVRALRALPLICVGITVLRVLNNAPVSIATHLRVDEILAGAFLALVYHGELGQPIKKLLSATPQLLLMALLLVASHPRTGFLNYLRPYCAAALVGSTLWRSENALTRMLSGGVLRYIATVSYALYVIHPLTMHGWLGTGGTIVKYGLKRPISFLLTFGLAHASTFWYEQRWIALGKHLSGRGKSEPQKN